jgi:6-phosphogluconate dehydrogenase
VRRTQLYLDEDLWNALHARARAERTTISDLVRQAIQDRYLGKLDERMEAMQAFVGSRKERSKTADRAEYVRSLRRANRMSRLGGE